MTVSLEPPILLKLKRSFVKSRAIFISIIAHDSEVSLGQVSLQSKPGFGRLRRHNTTTREVLKLVNVVKSRWFYYLIICHILEENHISLADHIFIY